MKVEEPIFLVELVLAVIGVLGIVFFIIIKKRGFDNFRAWIDHANKTVDMPLWEFIRSSTPKWFAFLGWLIILSVLIMLYRSSDLTAFAKFGCSLS